MRNINKPATTKRNISFNYHNRIIANRNSPIPAKNGTGPTGSGMFEFHQNDPPAKAIPMIDITNFISMRDIIHFPL